MKIFLLLILLPWTIESLGQGFLEMDTLDRFPSELKHLTAGGFARAIKVDFDGDGKQDFICEMIPDEMGKATTVEYWITSGLRLIKKKAKHGQDFDYYWFINLDDDAEPEIFSANGYEDGIDYAIYDQDLKTGAETLVSYVNPVIFDDGRLHWGYPWDISDMITKKEFNSVLIKASFDHDIERDGEVTMPEPSKKFPVIFFYGHPTQSSEVERIRKIRWLSIDELR
jgi:hypothetical protein